ncbi:hypothetical protein V1517DRAFT_353970 [Lipomyces orientalis]|uniref:Uncharacterized protein n=1 Tax=Lipomyces orientalis TaxID=1233043 RepID=A0ACC3TK47_9ASCO
MESKDASSAPDKDMDANYNRALNLLKNDPPERRLDIQLPPATCPGYIHESASSNTCPWIIKYAEDYLSTYSEELVDTIGSYGSTTTKSFRGAFEGSTKQPDGGVRYFYSGSNKVTVAVEVGFSEDYRSLCKDKDVWVDGHGVNVFILVCLTEKPQFKNPTTEYEDIGDVDAAIAQMNNSISETLHLNLSNNRNALFLYRSYKWAAELTDAFIEIWRPGSSIPSKYNLIQNGQRVMVSLPLGIKISDLFPDNAWQAADIPDKVIPFNATHVKKTYGRHVRNSSRSL